MVEISSYRRTRVRRCKRRNLGCLGFRNFKTDISIDVWILCCLKEKSRQINLRSMSQHPCPKSSPEWCLNRPYFRGKWGPSSPILWWRLESEIGKGMCWWHLKYLLAHHLVMHSRSGLLLRAAAREHTTTKKNVQLTRARVHINYARTFLTVTHYVLTMLIPILH